MIKYRTGENVSVGDTVEVVLHDEWDWNPKEKIGFIGVISLLQSFVSQDHYCIKLRGGESWDWHEARCYKLIKKAPEPVYKGRTNTEDKP